jgi:5-formyltetrahydrofolate cyclo-ligase
MTAQAMKQQLRQRIITARDALPEEERRAKSEAVRARLLDLPAYRAANTVLGYMHFGAELQSEPWVARVLADGKQLLLPKVNAATRELELYRVENLARDLAPGAWNILEPLPSCARFAPDESLDFILLPGVAFTRAGARLGYGGGFYDKLLARLKPGPALVAGAYSMQVVEAIPQEATDRRVEWLVTENETLHCAAQQRT